MRLNFRILKVFSLLSFLTLNTAQASFEGFYIGPKISNISFQSSDRSRNSKGSALGLSFGYNSDRLEKPYRLHFDIDIGQCNTEEEDNIFLIDCNDLPNNAEFEFLVLTLGGDYLFPIFHNTSFFIGLHSGTSAGGVHVKPHNINGYTYVNGLKDGDSTTHLGLAIGGQTGFIYDFSEHIQLELGLRYTWTNINGSNKTTLKKNNSSIEGPEYKVIEYPVNLQEVRYHYLKLIYLF